ncbi:hypothetical protein BDW74DRAFT_187033 [Aspergillus multicolor]|uniref:nucleic acid/nucleotide deaminase domain-containing protein n=1 Tax=Aspergillus multicolor TaxID=41759 RepID=UPI003CCDA2E0
MPSEPSRLQEERIARVVWAAHILAYLTKTRSHARGESRGGAVGSERDNEAEDKIEAAIDAEMETGSEYAAALSGSRDSVRQKFLDCICQLLSPGKGWDAVTAGSLREEEVGVTLDVARNDGFGSGCGDYDVDPKTLEYCRMMESYLASSSTASGNEPSIVERPLADFEAASIDYTASRIDYWIANCQKIYGRTRDGTNWQLQTLAGDGLAVQTWNTIAELLLQADSKRVTADLRTKLVQQAYVCINAPGATEVRQLLLDALGSTVGLRLWVGLRFLARPLLDCRLLRDIATWESDLRHAHISLVPCAPKTALDRRYVVDIATAWEKLGLGIATKPLMELLYPYGSIFKQACAKSLSLHADMQLVVYYKEHPELRPMLDYFGVSKKSCLLCETFLASLDSPIKTRGRLGLCYPAWGVPCSDSADIRFATTRLAKDLLNRIREFLEEGLQQRATAFLPNVMQSEIVSDCSSLTLKEWHQRRKDLETAKARQAADRTKLLLTEDRALASQTRTCPQQDFLPEDSCVICNKTPARQYCQTSDYPSHKLLCKQFSVHSNRPSPNHKRAILFPVDEKEPCLIWIPTKRQYSEDSRVWWTEVLKHPYLGPDAPCTGRVKVEYNEVRGRNLGSGFAAAALQNEGYCVALLHREEYLIDGSVANQSILASVRASSAATAPHAYRGPMIAMRATHSEGYSDIALSDFRHLMDYLVTYHNTNVRESIPGLQYPVRTSVRGVKICCDGVIKLHGSAPFVAEDVKYSTRLTLRTIQGDSISPISALLGMPLLFWRDPDAEFRDNPPGWEEPCSASSNENAARLMVGTEPSDTSWGLARFQWSWDVGNVWAIREDGQDLGVRDLAMMCCFARHKLARMFADVDESGGSIQDKQRVLSSTTWENMCLFWEETGNNGGVVA